MSSSSSLPQSSPYPIEVSSEGELEEVEDYEEEGTAATTVSGTSFASGSGSTLKRNVAPMKALYSHSPVIRRATKAQSFITIFRRARRRSPTSIKSENSNRSCVKLCF